MFEEFIMFFGGESSNRLGDIARLVVVFLEGFLLGS